MTTQQAVVYQQRRWTLDTLFSGPDDPTVNQCLTELAALADEIEAARPTLSSDISSELFVELFNRIFVLFGIFSSISRMLAIQIAKKHVLDAVCRVENTRHKSILIFFQGIQ